MEDVRTTDFSDMWGRKHMRERCIEKTISVSIFVCLVASVIMVVVPTESSAQSVSAGIYGGGTDPGVVYWYAGGTTWNTISGNLGWSVLSLVYHEGYLYAGTKDTQSGPAGRVYRYDGSSWTQVGSWNPGEVHTLTVYGDSLYAGLGWMMYGDAYLYRYDDPGWTLVGQQEDDWDGIRAAHVWDGYIYLGDIHYDRLGRYDVTSGFDYITNRSGSCIWDIQDYYHDGDDHLYASAWKGRLHRTEDGTTWQTVSSYDFYQRNFWEMELYDGHMYIGTDAGISNPMSARLLRWDGSAPTVNVWSIYVNNSYQGIISMATDGTYLYLGMGADITYFESTAGTGRVYRFDGTNVDLISGNMGRGIQVLYYQPNQPPVADFTWSPPLPYEGDQIQFTDNSSDPDGTIVSWEWTFEYLTPSTDQNPVRTYGDNGIYDVTLKVTDDLGATDSVTKQVTVENVCPDILEINSTLHENKQRTHGYWKKQCDFGQHNPPPSQDHVGIKQEYIDYIAANSIVWSDLTTKEQVCENLTIGQMGGSTMVQKLRMQLITVWLNVAAGFLFIDSPLNHPLTSAQSVEEFILIAEDAILRMEDGIPYNDPTEGELEDLKDVADDINNDAGSWQYTHPVVGEFEATVQDPGSDDLKFEWDFEGDATIDITVIYYNDPMAGPDPYPSPWGTYPFWVNDKHIVPYPMPPQTFEPTLYVTDDDGCMTEDEDPEDPWSANWKFEYNVTWKSIEFGFTIYAVPITYLEWDSYVTPRDPESGDPMYGNLP